jgi:hypothetical protein
MNNTRRDEIATALLAVCMVSFAAHLWRFHSLFAARPHIANPAAGLTVPLNQHGAYVYISATEATGLSLLMLAFYIAFILALIIVPKKYVPPAPGTAPWRTFLSVRYRTALKNPTPRLWTIFSASLLLSAGAIYLGGQALAAFLVAHGIVL